MVSISIEESIQRVKAEIIAPDWRLSAKRIESLEAAFACLKERYKSRKSLNAVLVMSGNVLEYVKARGDHSPPDTIDFLKEAMAHVVNLYEEGHFDPEEEERILNKVYARFQRLREKIKDQRPAHLQKEMPAAAGRPQQAEADQAPAAGRGSQDEAAGGGPPDGESGVSSAVEQGKAALLVAELQSSLQKAEEVRAALRRLLAAAEEQGWVPAGPAPRTAPGAMPRFRLADEPHPVKACPSTLLREFSIAGQLLAIPEEGIALTRPLAPAARTAYLREAQVPLSDFTRFFRGLSRQFRGMLGTMTDRKLKKLVLPVITIRGMDLPEVPDEQATTLVVLSHGHWHGALLCSGGGKETRNMVKFRKAPNGDIAGVGFLEDGGELHVVSLMELLRREGFLAIV